MTNSTATSTAIGAVYSIPSRPRWRLIFTRRRGAGAGAAARCLGGVERDTMSAAARQRLADGRVVAVQRARGVAGAEDRVDHGGRPRAVGVVERLAEVHRDRCLALAGEPVEHTQPWVLLG